MWIGPRFIKVKGVTGRILNILKSTTEVTWAGSTKGEEEKEEEEEDLFVFNERVSHPVRGRLLATP